MRQLLLLALATAVAAAVRLNQEDIKESIFRPGVEYTYRYESEALSGLRTGSDQLSGVKIRCTIKVQIHRDGNTLLKMQSINIYKINDSVTYDIVPEHQMTRMTDETAEVMVEALVKPVKFRVFLVTGMYLDLGDDPVVIRSTVTGTGSGCVHFYKQSVLSQ